MAYTFSQSGWCSNCGLRRGADGRCSNCDPWWTSPLIQVGGPLVTVAALALIVLSQVAGGRPTGGGSSFRANPNAPARSASPVAYADPSIAQPRGIVFPSVAGSLPPPNPDAALLRPVSRDAELLADLERLRGMVWYADSVARRRLEGTDSAYPTQQPQSGAVASGT